MLSVRTVNRKVNPMAAVSAKFDLNEGKKMVDAFFYASGVPCRLYTRRGELLYERGELTASCALCRTVTELTGAATQCDRIHIHGALQAERFGGRYIYFCPFDMAYFSSPIMMEGVFDGALVAGPILIMDREDYLEELMAERHIPRERAEELRQALSTLVQMEPERLSYLSEQLFANAVYISDSSHEIFLVRSENRQQNLIGEYIQMLKGWEDRNPYPLDKEGELSDAVARGDRESAGRLLNEILGHILFSSGSADVIRSRVTELLVTMSRAAIRGGSDPNRILDANHRYLGQLRRINSQEDMTRWLASVLNQFTGLVFELSDSKHKNSIHRAVEYMRANYAQKLTLTQVADYTGYSPAYFSRVFREELGCTFREYLNEVRVEKSKALLLSDVKSIAEISALVGFEDQSYFGKVFRKLTGVTPDRYRKRGRRIDADREHGAQ